LPLKAARLNVLPFKSTILKVGKLTAAGVGETISFFGVPETAVDSLLSSLQPVNIETISKEIKV
jgi:hypothetical protein